MRQLHESLLDLDATMKQTDIEVSKKILADTFKTRKHSCVNDAFGNKLTVGDMIVIMYEYDISPGFGVITKVDTKNNQIEYIVGLALSCDWDPDGEVGREVYNSKSESTVRIFKIGKK